jgi:lipopolysaccharide transport system ATP-binding protein
MSDIAIRVENMGKQYRIGEQERYKALRDVLAQMMTAPFRRLTNRSSAAGDPQFIWALNDVSFEVKHGEVIGIIGRNGAGKSTLLKILSRVTEPTEGYAEIHGRIGSLLEVGTGFHPELTGRENVFLNGAILGMKKTEIKRKFDEIVAFAEVERFIDTPVKRYSSGMYLRLAFAVAAHLEPEILLVDEVLAVGDATFQKKCLGKMGEVAKEGRTVLFVSHGMDAIRSLCKRVIWLDGGRIVADGEGSRVVSDYLDAMSRTAQEARSTASIAQANRDGQLLSVEKVVLKDAGKQISHRFPFGSEICVEIHFYALRPIEKPCFWVGIGEESSLFGAISLLDGVVPESIDGHGIIKCVFHDVRLLPRFYNIYMGIRDQNGTSVIFPSTCVSHLEVTGSPGELGLHGEIADAFIKTCAPFFIPYRWELPDGRRVEVNLKKLQKE